MPLKLEKLLNNYIKDFKVIFTTTKVSNYFSNKDTKNKVHKKKIDTNVILNFSAVAPTKWKRALILWFVNRARIIVSTHKIYKQEITNLKEKLFKNGYPKKFVDDVIERSIYLSMP